MFVDAVGNEKLVVLGPAVVLLGELDLFFAERFAVGGFGVLLVRRALADVAVDDDQRRPVRRVRGTSKARSSWSRSLASLTRVTFQP